MPDRKDEDCDGRVDENVDFTRANCPRGTHIIEGTRGNDVLHGTSGADCILGYGGNDTIYGERGNDAIFGGPGADSIFPGKGTTVVHAGAGDDMVDTTGGIASTVFGEAGEDNLIGGSGADIFFGGDDNDVLKGGGGPDVLNGGGCHDLLLGGNSFDLGTGGPDYDACEAEVNSECEKSAASRKVCTTDANCKSTERCAHNSGFCVPRSAAACSASTCTPTRSVDDTCNGVDDDCDGRIDDDFVARTVNCGVGACSATGMISCVAGAEQNSCHVGAPQPGNDATCNAADEDCDGHVDEGFVSAATSCGVGACARSGLTTCTGGSVVDSCTAGGPLAASDTSCDGVDDDCDGAIDEEFVATTTSCGVGACASGGLTACTGGHVSDSCVEGDPLAASDTSCDGIDDDCDGTSDEEFVSAATGCGLGVCASAGVTSCVGGVASDSCMPGQPTSTVDTCNGLDDDCDGSTDEDFVASATDCGFGACLRHGMTSCVAGHVENSCHVDCEGQCNDGAEDDADGVVDCADPDCSHALGCFKGSFGSPCETNSDCNSLGPEAFCVLGFPGGYCTHPCSAGCPSGTACLADAACVVLCGPGDHCGRQGFACGAIPEIDPAVPPVMWCHPTCMQSCAAGTCDPVSNLCL